jgi:hypothetical protein
MFFFLLLSMTLPTAKAMASFFLSLLFSTLILILSSLTLVASIRNHELLIF